MALQDMDPSSGPGELLLHHSPEGRQGALHGIPHILSGHVLIIVPVDIARSGHLPPCNRRMPLLKFVGQTTRCLGNDLKTTGDSVYRAQILMKRGAIETRDEMHGKVNVKKNVAKRDVGGIRRHRWRQRSFRLIETRSKAM